MSASKPLMRFIPQQTKKSTHMGGAAGHRPSDDDLPLFRTYHAATVSGRTSMAAQPGTATDSNESTPLPS